MDVDTIVPAVALAVGFIGAMLTEYVRDASAVRRGRKRRLADLQRQSLIDLQDALAQLARASSSLASARRRRHAERNDWLPAEEFIVHHEALAEARMPVVTLVSRLDDIALRGLVGAFREADAALTTAETPQDAIEWQARLSDALVAAIERCGELLRQT
jgi:hypothetical protein